MKAELLGAELNGRRMGTQGIYRVIPDVLESLYSRPGIKGRHEEDIEAESEDSYTGFSVRILAYDSQLNSGLAMTAYLRS